MLPVEQCWTSLADCLVTKNAILVAPPGAGKSTYLPLKLLATEQFSQTRIIMLQPRQVAVRSIAQYLSAQLNQPVGGTVGYRMRGESKVSASTRLEIVTEGLLTRIIQTDPEMSDIGLVIFDEFHERNIHSDFSLALCLEVQQSLRPDLRLLVMSATLDEKTLLPYLPDAQLIESKGKSFALEYVYRPPAQPHLWLNHLVTTVIEAAQHYAGDILVFLPGAGEINKTQQQLMQRGLADIQIVSLYGDLSASRQQAALSPAPAGMRKIVLATNIAETSLTIDGIRIVVDSGLEKVASFDFARKLPDLSLQKISKASSVQRAGRAARQGEGVCFRLWSSETQSRLVEQKPAEILVSEISSLVLDALLWGSRLDDLALIETPSQAQQDYANSLLRNLQAVDKNGAITAKGRQLAGMGCAPRLANLLLHGAELGGQATALACLLVALLEGKQLKMPTLTVSITRHIDFLLDNPSHPLWTQAKRWGRRLACNLEPVKIRQGLDYLAELLIGSFFSHLALVRSQENYLLAGGTGAQLPKDSEFYGQRWLIIPQLTIQGQSDAKIRLAESISETGVLALCKDQIITQTSVIWDDDKQKVVSRQRQFLGEIVLSDQPVGEIDPQQCQSLLLEKIAQKGLTGLIKQEAALQFIHRVSMAKRFENSDWPNLTEGHLLSTLEQWLAPYLNRLTSWKQLEQLNWLEILTSLLSYEQSQRLNQNYPTHVKVPTGRLAALSYQEDGSVLLSIRMQEMFGCKQSPAVANGKLPVQLNLLSPAMRLLQKTQDLEAFWQGSYQQIKKEMKGRYPKHYWPDDPAQAVATTKVKSKM